MTKIVTTIVGLVTKSKAPKKIINKILGKSEKPSFLLLSRKALVLWENKFQIWSTFAQDFTRYNQYCIGLNYQINYYKTKIFSNRSN